MAESKPKFEGRVDWELPCIAGMSLSLAGTLWLLLKLGLRSAALLITVVAITLPVHLLVGFLFSLAFDLALFGILLLHWRYTNRQKGRECAGEGQSGTGN